MRNIAVKIVFNMNNKMPKQESSQSEPVVIEEIEMPNQESSEVNENEQQNAQEKACIELFIKEIVVEHKEMTPEQKIFVSEYVSVKPGAWRWFNGDDFRVAEQSIEDNVWKVVFGVFLDDYEAQRIDVEIPLFNA